MSYREVGICFVDLRAIPSDGSILICTGCYPSTTTTTVTLEHAKEFLTELSDAIVAAELANVK